MRNQTRKQHAGSAKSETDGWIEIGMLDDIPRQGARVVRTPQTATSPCSAPPTTKSSRCATAARTRAGRCRRASCTATTVACPLHDWKISLDTGVAVAPDEGCAARFPVRVEGGKVFLADPGKAR